MRTQLLLFVSLMSCTGAPEGDRATAQSLAKELAVQKVKNVLLITVDTLRADALGVNGGAAATPVMDRLARNGWHFDNCISASMLTNPSHASIMTSLYPRDHGVYDNESGIPGGLRTVALAMRRHGHRTAAVIGFPHLNPEVSNLGQGFETVVPATRNELRADATSQRALAVLDQIAEDEPFFMWIHYVDPHAPYDPPEGHALKQPTSDARTALSVAAKAAPGFQRKNPWFKRAFKKYGTVEDLVQRYMAEVEATDAGIGMLIDGLRKRNRMKQTALILTSDHGENLGEHDLYFHHGGLYRETIQVPLIISMEGAAPTRIGGLVETVDIAPTVLELVGASRWEPMRGKSLVSIVREDAPTRRFAFSEHMLAQQVSVRSDEGALILHRKSTRQFPSYRFTDGRREVYDTVLDLGEEQDIGTSGPLAARLGTALEGYLETGLHLTARAAVDQDRESLRALGYIE